MRDVESGRDGVSRSMSEAAARSRDRLDKEAAVTTCPESSLPLHLSVCPSLSLLPSLTRSPAREANVLQAPPPGIAGGVVLPGGGPHLAVVRARDRRRGGGTGPGAGQGTGGRRPVLERRKGKREADEEKKNPTQKKKVKKVKVTGSWWVELRVDVAGAGEGVGGRHRDR
eukprot:757937-Hanusia_phi.AAC.1